MLHLLKTPHTGTAGYLLSNSGARFFLTHLRSLSSQDYYAVDHVMFDANLKSIKAYQLVPALCVQADRLNPTKLASVIKQGRDEIAPKKKKHRTATRYINKLYRSIGKRTFFKTVSFE